ncbi:MAG: hypothetical protein ACXW4U_04355 [Anaerolineales bacterium]
MNFVNLPIQIQVVIYTRPSYSVAGKQADTVQGMLRKALRPIEHDFCQKREDSLDRQANDLEDIGILVGEVYDERIIEECLQMGRNPINEVLVNSNYRLSQK